MTSLILKTAIGVAANNKSIKFHCTANKNPWLKLNDIHSTKAILATVDDR